MKTWSALLLALLAAGAFAQGAYRWVDKNGKVHYTDEPPPAEAQKVEKKRLDASVVGGDRQPYETRQAMADFPVTLYVSASCGSTCDEARSYLKRRSIPFAEKTVATPADIAAFRQATQSEVTPTLTVGKMVGKGFQEADWAGLLDTAGYPRQK